MTKKLIVTLAAMALVANPIFPKLSASSGSWQPLQASAAWDHGDHRVEKLVFASDAYGPVSMGEHVLVAEPIKSCKPNDCDRYDIYILKNGMKLALENVSDKALDPIRYDHNGQRFIYVSQTDLNGKNFSVVERNLESGDSDILVEDAFLQHPSDLDVLVSQDQIVFNPEFNLNRSKLDYKQAGTYVWDEKGREALPIAKHAELNREELMDVRGTVVLVKMVFKSGHKELWLMDSKTVNGYRGSMNPIKGTWTDPSEDIVAAHFTKSGKVEYFRNFTRNTYDPVLDALPTEHVGETLNWFRDESVSRQIVNDRMAWVDHTDALYISDDGLAKNVGQARAGQFYLENDRLFYATEEGGAVYDIITGSTWDLPIAVTDTQENIYVGRDSDGNIVYHNTSDKSILNLGKGTNATIADKAHVYWRGLDGGIYEATVLPAKKVATSSVRAVRTPEKSTVYLVIDGNKYTFLNEQTYFTWFDSWDEVKWVGQGVIDAYEPEGNARFAPGTLVKPHDSNRVYLVGRDNQLHWIANQTIAFQIYGQNWNKNIAVVPFNQLVDYRIGSQIMTERDITEL